MPAPEPRPRVAVLDLLRGLVMVLMALDHSRAFLGGGTDPLDLATTTPAWFLTRWVTHFCAPVFVALAGLSAALYARRVGVEVARRFLVSRGLWLILLEVTVVNFCWQFSFYHVSLLVIWALGASMITLAVTIRLHRLAPLLLGLVVLLGHDLLSGIDPADMGSMALPWGLALAPYGFSIGSLPVGVSYPFLPWAGLMALGWASAPWLMGDGEVRPRRAIALGLGLLAAFVLLRSLGLYGDPRPWTAQERGWSYTMLSFLDCAKYPPSLHFLLMTLGPALLLLPLLERVGRHLAPLLQVFGRVPLFFYLLHIPLIHLGARLWSLATLGPDGHLDQDLGRVYQGWVLVLVLLWPLCQAWGRHKAAHPERWWLRYV